MDRDTGQPPPALWVPGPETPHADCRVFQVLRRHFKHPERASGDDFFVVKPADWAVALAETSDNRWVLVRQFRFGSRELSWEFPSGAINPGEEPAQAARRELEEESGYVGDEPIFLGQVHPNPAIMDNRCHFFLFRNAQPSGRIAWDPHEELEVKTASQEAVVEMAARGTITHSLVHAALFFHRAWAERNP